MDVSTGLAAGSLLVSSASLGVAWRVSRTATRRQLLVTVQSSIFSASGLPEGHGVQGLLIRVANAGSRSAEVTAVRVMHPTNDESGPMFVRPPDFVPARIEPGHSAAFKYVPLLAQLPPTCASPTEVIVEDSLGGWYVGDIDPFDTLQLGETINVDSLKALALGVHKHVLAAWRSRPLND